MATLVVQTSFLGDVVLTTPLIAELASRGPVDVLTTPPGSGVLANNPGIRNLLAYDKRGADRGVTGFLRIAQRVRRPTDPSASVPGAGSPRDSERAYEAAYLAQGSVRSAMLALWAGIRERIGFETSAGARLYTRRVAYRTDKHQAERLWWLSMSECADPPLQSQIAPRVFPSDSDRAVADAVLAQFGAGSGAPVVALAPGSAWGTKRWPFFPELAVLLAKDFRIVVIGAEGDVQLGEQIIHQLAPGTGVNAAGKLGILAAAALIGRCTALVTNDSAPQHLASAMGTPTITVFGPTVPEFGFGPLAARSASAGHNSLACRPCHPHGPQRCPLGHWRCMRELSSREVFDLLRKTLP